VLLRLAYLGMANVFALLRLPPMSVGAHVIPQGFDQVIPQVLAVF
jgi:hypothetical protein